MPLRADHFLTLHNKFQGYFGQIFLSSANEIYLHVLEVRPEHLLSIFRNVDVPFLIFFFFKFVLHHGALHKIYQFLHVLYLS